MPKLTKPVETMDDQEVRAATERVGKAYEKNPRDPVNGNKAEWKTVLAKEGGVSDVRSLSNERGANGTPYADW